MTAYLDASALLPMLIEEPGSAIVDDFIGATSGPLVVSEFAAAEVASALSRLVRTARISPEDATARLADFDAWRVAATEDIDMNAADVRLANIFVRRFDLILRAPDALHAAICRRANLALITLDRRLATAAEVLGVETRLLQMAR
ncbi:type II toxin-antitoxin system VapC family toxin [Phenylobacterium sp. LjRoot219]|uniref:type II toxin-antitoxin system VapC family toxin n=1 Tax=Phenylobacterium sp. LjRoot219 TaxID=3342283 RepID=UPI003ED07139